MKKKLPRVLINVGLILLSLLFCEFLFRQVLFSRLEFAKWIQNPGDYFNYFTDDDFWRLNFLTGEKLGKPAYMGTHPELGWSGRFDPQTYVHEDEKDRRGRIPVLLYGDSFGACTQTKTCFQHLFNQDPRVNKKCFLLNYSVGAYGVDQILMLMKKTLSLYEKPIVIYSLLTQDLDRATQTIFVSPKPYYVIDQGELVRRGTPIDSDSAHFFESNPPRVFSYLGLYLYRKLMGVSGYLMDPVEIPRVLNISKLVLDESLKLLKERSRAFFAAVFVPNWLGESFIQQADADDWRLVAIKESLQRNEVPFLVTKDVLRKDMKEQGLEVDAYFVPNDGHPNDRQNQLVYDAMLKHLGHCRP